MREKSKDEVIRLLAEKFPAVPDGEMAIAPDSPCDGEFDAAMKHNAHLAVHVNDKYHRDSMLYFVRANLLWGNPLSEAERAWLLYVLSKLPDMPHEGKGRAIRRNERLQLVLKLIGFIAADKKKNPRGTVTDRLRRASAELGKSYEAIRALYYSSEFKNLSAHYRARRIIE